MNIHALAADIASRVPEMAKDSPQNNADLIEGLIREELAKARRERWVTPEEVRVRFQERLVLMPPPTLDIQPIPPGTIVCQDQPGTK